MKQKTEIIINNKINNIINLKENINNNFNNVLFYDEKLLKNEIEIIDKNTNFKIELNKFKLYNLIEFLSFLLKFKPNIILVDGIDDNEFCTIYCQLNN